MRKRRLGRERIIGISGQAEAGRPPSIIEWTEESRQVG
jgi:hypothetical protein